MTDGGCDNNPKKRQAAAAAAREHALGEELTAAKASAAEAAGELQGAAALAERTAQTEAAAAAADARVAALEAEKVALTTTAAEAAERFQVPYCATIYSSAHIKRMERIVEHGWVRDAHTVGPCVWMSKHFAYTDANRTIQAIV